MEKVSLLRIKVISLKNISSKLLKTVVFFIILEFRFTMSSSFKSSFKSSNTSFSSNLKCFLFDYTGIKFGFDEVTYYKVLEVSVDSQLEIVWQFHFLQEGLDV